MRSPCRTACIAAVPLLLFVGCGRTDVAESPEGVLVLGAVQETRVEQRSVALEQRKLVIEGENGAVSLAGEPGSDVSLTFNIQARGDTRAQARRQLDRLVIEEAGDDVGYSFDIRPDRPDVTNVDVTGTVPRGADIRLVLRSGNVTISNIDGRIDVLLESGSISYLGGTDNINLVTRNGDVAADFYSLDAGAVVDLATTNGNVAVGLPLEADASIRATTRAGRVLVDGVRFTDPYLSLRGAGSRFSATLGAGGPSINMKTQNGDLAFARKVLNPPPADTLTTGTPADTTGVATPTEDSTAVDSVSIPGAPPGGPAVDSADVRPDANADGPATTDADSTAGASAG